MNDSLGPTLINPNHEHTFGVVFGGFDGDEVSFRACRCGHYPVVAPLVFPQPESRAVELLRELEGAVDREIAMFTRAGAVFDKWPVADHFGSWSDKELAALDPETRWQGIAFSVYTSLAGLSGKARSFLQDQQPIPASSEGRDSE